MLFNFSKKKKDWFYLDEIIQSIGESMVRARIGIDIVAIKARRESYEYDEIMKMLPFITFKISDVEIGLKFIVTGLETQELDKNRQSDKIKDAIHMDDDTSISLNKRIIVNMDIDDLAKTDPSMVCNITYKMTQRMISEYSVDNKNIVLEHTDER